MGKIRTGTHCKRITTSCEADRWMCKPELGYIALWGQKTTSRRNSTPEGGKLEARLKFFVSTMPAAFSNEKGFTKSQLIFSAVNGTFPYSRKVFSLLCWRNLQTSRSPTPRVANGPCVLVWALTARAGALLVVCPSVRQWIGRTKLNQGLLCQTKFWMRLEWRRSS